MRKLNFTRTFIVFCGLLLALLYGVLIGKYQIFPYNLLKNLQDGTEETMVYTLKDSLYSPKQVRALIKVNQSNRDSIQSELNNIIYGTQNLNRITVPALRQVNDELYEKIKNLDYLEEFRLRQSYNLMSIGYIFHPKTKNDRLLLYHQGHDGDFGLGKNSIAFFIEKGFTVYAFSMPLKGKNNYPLVTIPGIGKVQLINHEEIKYLENPLQFYIGPIKNMIDYAEQFDFKDINMVGISGGGWTTTLAAAADNRITNSFPVAGTLPLFVKFQEYTPNYGDFEQTYLPLVSRINYLDLYILGATGQNRNQLQILNLKDPCCFYGTGFKQYEEIVSNEVKEFKSGSFNVISDTLNQEHSISDWSLEQIWEVLNY